MTQSVPSRTKTRAAGVGLLLSLVAGAVLAFGTPASAHHIDPVVAPAYDGESVGAPVAGKTPVTIRWTQPVGGPIDRTVAFVDDPATAPSVAPMPPPEEDFFGVASPGVLSTVVEVPTPAAGVSKTYVYRLCNQRNAFTDAGGVFHPQSAACTGPAPSLLPDNLVATYVAAGWRSFTVTGPVVPPCTPGTTGCPQVPFASWYAPFKDVNAWVNQMFNDFTGRQPRLDERVFWTGQLETDRTTGNGACSTTAVVADKRALDFNCTAAVIQLEDLRKDYLHPEAAAVIRLYRSYFLRVGEYAGLDFWIDAREDGRSIQNISQFFADSAEFDRRYGDLDNGEFVALVYLNVLNRPLDSAGYAYWLRELNAGNITRGRMMVGFSESPENKTRTMVEVAAVESQFALLKKVPTEAELSYLRERFGSINATEPPVQLMQVLYSEILQRSDYIQRVQLTHPWTPPAAS